MTSSDINADNRVGYSAKYKKAIYILCTVNKLMTSIDTCYVYVFDFINNT